MDAFYNLEIPPCRETLSFSAVKALPVFGADANLFQVGHRALFVMELTTREKMLEYTWDHLLAPIIETVKDERGVLSFAFQMIRVEID